MLYPNPSQPCEKVQTLADGPELQLSYLRAGIREVKEHIADGDSSGAFDAVLSVERRLEGLKSALKEQSKQ